MRNVPFRLYRIGYDKWRAFWSDLSTARWMIYNFLYYFPRINNEFCIYSHSLVDFEVHNSSNNLFWRLIYRHQLLHNLLMFSDLHHKRMNECNNLCTFVIKFMMYVNAIFQHNNNEKSLKSKTKNKRFSFLFFVCVNLFVVFICDNNLPD